MILLSAPQKEKVRLQAYLHTGLGPVQTVTFCGPFGNYLVQLIKNLLCAKL